MESLRWLASSFGHFGYDCIDQPELCVTLQLPAHAQNELLQEENIISTHVPCGIGPLTQVHNRKCHSWKVLRPGESHVPEEESSTLSVSLQWQFRSAENERQWPVLFLSRPVLCGHCYPFPRQCGNCITSTHSECVQMEISARRLLSY